MLNIFSKPTKIGEKWRIEIKNEKRKKKWEKANEIRITNDGLFRTVKILITSDKKRNENFLRPTSSIRRHKISHFIEMCTDVGSETCWLPCIKMVYEQYTICVELFVKRSNRASYSSQRRIKSTEIMKITNMISYIYSVFFYFFFFRLLLVSSVLVVSPFSLRNIKIWRSVSFHFICHETLCNVSHLHRLR